jgi:hypothetical protein
MWVTSVGDDDGGDAVGSSSAQATVMVGDGMPGVPLDSLEADLSDRAHREALATYGEQPGCHYMTFAGDRPGDRQGLEQALTEAQVPLVDRVGIMAEWDDCQRPVAVLHWGAARVH